MFMLSARAGRQPILRSAIRVGLGALVVLGAGVLQGCTTTEGTNALTDVGTFEREVMTETLKGVGMLDRDQKNENVEPRGPLVLPKDDSLPPPQDAKTNTAEAQLPEDSDKVKVDTTGLSAADLARIKNARVFDPISSSGRPLTNAEIAKLTAQMQNVTIKKGKRPLYFPPESYFTTVKGQDMVCLAPNGDLVSLTDPTCPPDVKKALAKQQAKG